ncbi:uncharacterized protein M421DRAFT_371378 [Didymella exigua CBS 183.55]|uniref:Uncharacterized protein n=1 Tax=Didymella exigua CBS 183.55 TaxID=1150837 RepID=A0A6A5RTG8_9PLEO|nr:uncharacterized protein M421DRAFT_371378 [Didymella exigua CBS 183.55]KAF1930318.1 hypothetical protein M421DRAFT_371378 [Didymella exigua CBS 183.55]
MAITTAVVALPHPPLLSSTASLVHAFMEWLTNSYYISPAPLDSVLSRFLTCSASQKPTVTRGGTETDKYTQQEVEAAKELAMIPEWFTHLFNTGVFPVASLNIPTVTSVALKIIFSRDCPKTGSCNKQGWLLRWGITRLCH